MEWIQRKGKGERGEVVGKERGEEMRIVVLV